MALPEFDVAWEPHKAHANLAKHGVSFAQGATALLDPLALTVLDTVHSENEERWFTVELSSEGTLLALAHTYESTGPARARVRIISVRPATRREREQYQNEPR